MTLHHARFDTIIVGGGQAGPSLASALDARGEKVALFQDGPFGGTCLNDGCRPTKALRASAHAAHAARAASEHGVHTGTVTVDVAAAIARKDRIIGGWRDGATDYYAGHESISYVTARARLAGKDGDDFLVTFADADGATATVRAPRVILNTGTRSAPPAIPGLDAVDYLDHHTLLDLREAPARLLVLGGSYIGLELGQIWSRFGSHVTVLQRGERILSREDTDVSEAIAAALTAEGMEIRTGVAIERVDASPHTEATPGGGVRLTLTGGETIEGDRLLVALGRVPNTDDLGLETVGVATDERGFVTTDDHFVSNIPGIYAVGDINGRGAFTHTSYQDGEILADHLAGGSRSAAGRVPTYAVFTDPPMGRVGMTLAEARATGKRIEVADYPMDKLTRAVLEGVSAGFVRLVIDADADRLLGAMVLGLHGDEVIQSLSLLMHVDGPASALATWLPIHPTVSEFLPTIYAGRTPA